LRFAGKPALAHMAINGGMHPLIAAGGNVSERAKTR